MQRGTLPACGVSRLSISKMTHPSANISVLVVIVSSSMTSLADQGWVPTYWRVKSATPFSSKGRVTPKSHNLIASKSPITRTLAPLRSPCKIRFSVWR